MQSDEKRDIKHYDATIQNRFMQYNTCHIITCKSIKEPEYWLPGHPHVRGCGDE
jgi:hypothetical protein